MHLLTATPDHRLAPFVRCFARREAAREWPVLKQPTISSLEQSLAFDFGDPTVRTYPSGSTDLRPHIHLKGAQTIYTGAGTCLSGHVLSFAIFFRPFALWRLFGIPPGELADVECDGTTVLAYWAAELFYKLAEAETFAAMIKVANEILLPLVRNARPLTRVMSTAHMLLPSGEPAIASVASESGMSIRNYERQFAAEIGMSPKTLARVVRFTRAIDMKRASEKPWIEIAHHLGYFDQMHMIRDFRLLGGDTPGRLVRHDSDFLPWSVPGAVIRLQR